MRPLTDQQNRVLSFVEQYQAEHGFPPTLREIGSGVQVSNVSAVRGHLAALEKKGYITKDPDKARSIRVVQAPSALSRLKRKMHELARTDQGVIHHVVYALAWTMRPGRPLPAGRLADRVGEALEREAVEHGWELLARKIEPGHVAVVVKVWPNHSPEQTVRRLQAAGEAAYRRHGGERPAGGLWERGYAAATDPALLDDLVAELVKGEGDS